MEYVEGRSLGELLRARQKIATADAVRVAIDVAEALRCANAKGLPGSRLSADRVVLSNRGEVKLLPPTLTPAGAPVLDDAYVLAATGVLLYAMVSGGRVPDLDAALEPGSAAAAALPPLKSVAIGTRQGVAQVVERLLGIDAGNPYPNAEAAIADLRRVLQSQERVESRTRNVTERAERRRKRNLLGLAIGISVAAVFLTIVVILLLRQASIARGIERDYEDAARAAAEHIKQFNAANKKFREDPTEEGAKAALVHLEAAKGPYAEFREERPTHRLGREAARQIEKLDKDIEQFRIIAQSEIRYAEARRAIQAVDAAIEAELKRRVNEQGGTIDLDHWRAQYAQLRNQFHDSPRASDELARRIRNLAYRVEEAQLDVDTNELSRKYQHVYLPNHQFGQALADWAAYRRKYAASQFDRIREDAMNRYEQSTLLIENEGRRRLAALMNQARSRANQGNHAGARELYNQVAQSGLDEYVQRAKKELEKLPRE
jgi:hypothetical protein